LNDNADPYFPDADHVPFATVPAFPLPDASPTNVPEPSLNEYAATSEVGAAVPPAGQVTNATSAARTASEWV
jgi:hypothetical protein